MARPGPSPNSNPRSGSVLLSSRCCTISSLRFLATRAATTATTTAVTTTTLPPSSRSVAAKAITHSTTADAVCSSIYQYRRDVPVHAANAASSSLSHTTAAAFILPFSGGKSAAATNNEPPPPSSAALFPLKSAVVAAFQIFDGKDRRLNSIISLSLSTLSQAQTHTNANTQQQQQSPPRLPPAAQSAASLLGLHNHHNLHYGVAPF